MHLASKTLTLAALLLAPAACGNGSVTTGAGGGSTHSSSSGAGTGGGPTAEKACADSAKASCTLRDSCSNGYQDKKLYGDEPTCEMRTSASCMASLGSKGDSQTPATIEACVAAYPTYTCPDYIDSNPPAACVPAAGTGAMGSACGVSGQCASTFCAVSQYEVCGTCQPLPVVGATCAVPADCGRDLACAKTPAATTGTCAAFVALNGACLSNVNPCEGTLSCVGDDVVSMKMGVCQTAGAMVGVACDGSRKTMPSCQANSGLSCIPAMKGTTVGTCQLNQLVAAGMPCGDIGAAPITGFAACPASGLCAKAAPADAMGTCVAAAADGAACDNDPAMGPPCVSPAKCVPTVATATAGKCTPPDANKCM